VAHGGRSCSWALYRFWACVPQCACIRVACRCICGSLPNFWQDLTLGSPTFSGPAVWHLSLSLLMHYSRLPPPHNQIYSRNWYAFSMLELTKFPPQYGGGFTFYYTKYFLNRFIPHVYRARPTHGPWTSSKKVRIWPKIEYSTFCWQPEMEIASFSQRTGLSPVRKSYR